MYFATLTEVPILRGLIDSGMGQGPALALLLAGPALSLPNMLVINSILGPKKTLTFVGLVVVMATVTGMIFGTITGESMNMDPKTKELVAIATALAVKCQPCFALHCKRPGTRRRRRVDPGSRPTGEGHPRRRRQEPGRIHRTKIAE